MPGNKAYKYTVPLGAELLAARARVAGPALAAPVHRVARRLVVAVALRRAGGKFNRENARHVEFRFKMASDSISLVIRTGPTNEAFTWLHER